MKHDPVLRLQSTIDHINTHHNDASFCMISGDMVNRETAEDYAALADYLKELRIPYYPMVGNHDDRELFRAHLPLPAATMKNFAQYTVNIDDSLIVALDTLKAGSSAGELCSIRMDWLQKAIQTSNALNIIIFMHHPPMPLGLPMQDIDKLDNGADFIDLIAGFSTIKYLCIGHVHRPITGSVRGIPFATMRSVLLQAPAPRPEWNWDTFTPAREAPGMGIVTVAGEDITIQYDQICTFDTGTSV